MTRIIFMSCLVFIVHCTSCIVHCAAQDVHFSQYRNTPLIMNPAMTGVFDGKLRFSNNYRTQWSGITKAYTTVHASLDLPVARSNYKKDYFGLGVVVMQDEAGAGNYKNTTVLGSLAYTFPLDDNDSYLSAGFQGGFTQISFDNTKATWGSQWNGDTFDPTTGNYSPNIEETRLAAPDLNAGVLWHYEPDAHNYAYFGASGYHLSGQSISLYSSAESPIERRYTATAGCQKSMDAENSIFLIPSAMFMMQGKQKEIVAGASVKNKVQFKSRYTSFKKEVLYSFGLNYRVQDAIIVLASLEYNFINLGFSYDYTVSSLRKNAGSGNAFEVTLAIFNPVGRGERGRRASKSPKFF